MTANLESLKRSAYIPGNMRTMILLAVLIVSAPSLLRAPEDPLLPLRFLIGDWIAVDTPPGETGSFTFKLAVQDRLLVRTNEANYAETPERAASHHEDLLIIYIENGALKGDYFDNEGHVIRYAVQSPKPNAVLFISDPSPREPRYRLTYTLASGGILFGSFEIAVGSPEAFKPYLSWKARRR